MSPAGVSPATRFRLGLLKANTVSCCILLTVKMRQVRILLVDLTISDTLNNLDPVYLRPPAGQNRPTEGEYRALLRTFDNGDASGSPLIHLSNHS